MNVIQPNGGLNNISTLAVAETTPPDLTALLRDAAISSRFLSLRIMKRDRNVRRHLKRCDQLMIRAAMALDDERPQAVASSPGIERDSATWGIEMASLPPLRVAEEIRQLPTVPRQGQGLFAYIREIQHELRQPAYLCDDDGNIVGHTEGEPGFLVSFLTLLLMAFVFAALAIMLPDGGVWAAF